MSRLFAISIFLQALIAPYAFSDSLLQDPTFKRGYQVISPQRDIYTGQVKVDAIHGNDPVWRLVQWGNVRSLAETVPTSTPRGGKQWVLSVSEKDQGGSYKRVALEPEGELILELNALARFTQYPYQHLEGEDLYLNSLEQYWPHLLMAQSLDATTLSGFHRLHLAVDAKLLFDRPNKTDGYDPALHAARFPVIVGVRNTLSHQMFWLSLVLYDDRTPETGFNCQKCVVQDKMQEQCRTVQKLDDAGRWKCPFDGVRWPRNEEKSGTGKMIFRIPTKAARETSTGAGEWQHFEVDLMPYLRAGIEAARDNVGPKSFPTDLRFYRLSHFSLGWEITGLNHAAMAVKNISLKGE